jgi:hypothetical protein
MSMVRHPAVEMGSRSAGYLCRPERRPTTVAISRLAGAVTFVTLSLGDGDGGFKRKYDKGDARSFSVEELGQAVVVEIVAEADDGVLYSVSPLEPASEKC